VVAPAQHLVPHVLGAVGVPDDDLLALGDHHPADGPGVVGGPGAAPAQRLHLQPLHAVGELEHASRAGEQVRPEVGGDPETEDVHVHLVDEAGELLDLLGGVKLNLVADEVVHPPAVGAAAHDLVPEVGGVADLHRRHREPEPGGQDGLAGAVVAGEDQTLPPAGGVVVVHLQGEGGLAGVHRPREEDELGH
jgi:hypothetical protein